MAEKAKTLREQIGMTPDEFLQMGKVGGIYYNQGNYEKARKIFEGMVELDPTSADAQTSLGGVYTQLKLDDQALPHLDKATELNPNEISPYTNRGEIYLRKQDLVNAVANLKKAIELDPEVKDPIANRARAMMMGIAETVKEVSALTPEQLTELANRATQPIKEADGVM